MIFLVRHAEKLADADDPELSPAGVERAAALAALLSDSAIDRVHSSDYARSRDTARPVAAALGLEVELYDAFDLPALAATLLRAGGRHLVVGHSNTTPEMVALLGGEPGTPIDEESEYDRLYVVTVTGGEVSTLLLRYGEAWTGAAVP